MKLAQRSDRRVLESPPAESSERRRSWRLHAVIATLTIALAGMGFVALLAMERSGEADRPIREPRRLHAVAQPLLHDTMVGQSRAHHQRGDVALFHHDLPGAHTEYEAAFEIARRLVEQEPENAAFRRHLSMSYNRLGDLKQAGGDFVPARELFTKSLELRQTLAGEDPQNKGLQRDLSVSYSKLGKLAQHQGNLPLARELVERSLTLSETLAKGDPLSVERQLDLATNHIDLAALIAGATEPAAYRAHRNAAGEILERLDRGGLVPGNARFAMLHDRFVQMRE